LDTSTNIQTTVVTGLSGNWWGCCVGTDGRIYYAPYESSDILVLNPVTDTTSTTATGLTPISCMYKSVCISKTGNLYFAPYNEAQIMKLTPAGVVSFLQPDFFLNLPKMEQEEPCKIMEGFLEPEKCQYLVDTYRDRCKRSTVVDAAGKDVVDPARTSSTYFMPNEDLVIVELRRKAAAMAGVPESHVEGLQLVRYAKGEQYKFHYDYFDAIRHNQREHTFLVYLNDFGLEEGGSTIFKNYGIKVYPKQGRCVWFRNMIDGKLNPKSLHSGEEVHSDKIKYAVNIWIREKPVDDYSSIVVKSPQHIPVRPTLPTLPTHPTPSPTSLKSPFPLILCTILFMIVLVALGWTAYTLLKSGRIPKFPTNPLASLFTFFRR
jgi:prolyl 4-hydroxylase